MKKKGLFVVLFFGGIMVTSGFGLQSLIPNTPIDDSVSTITGTPADNFPDDQRAQFCGSGIARSTDYVQEFTIPTVCTNPLAIITDYDGNVWFTQTNTGNLAKFDPNTELFTEYENDLWPQGGRSMMWGADYAPDNSVWFTDDSYDSLWKFSVDDGEYTRVNYPSGGGDSLPQKLLIDGSQIIVNDFTGNKITFLNPTLDSEDLSYLSIPSLLNSSVTSAFTLDVDDNVWYTNWIFQQGGVLIKFKQNEYREHVAISGQEFLLLSQYIDVYPLPQELNTPNGITISEDNTLWLADTSSSHFFNFDPTTAQYIQYVTADPAPSTYGNLTGLIKSPISRPYWIESDQLGRLVFNEQTANNISVMDLKAQSLVEYQIPSKNPGWSDCSIGTGSSLDNCGVAQIFDFAIDGEKIWFTEWAENNIGVVDTSVPLPFEVLFPFDSTIVLANGTGQNLDFILSLQPSHDLLDVSLIASSAHDFLDVNLSGSAAETLQLSADAPSRISVTVTASDDALPGIYKILLGGQSTDVAVSKYLTVHIP